MDAQALRKKLDTLPLRMRQWLSSEDAALQIKNINEHFGIRDDNQKIVPRLILRLEIQDLEPDYFSGELSEELKLERDKSLAITAEVKRIVLGPIKKELSDIGVDINLMDQFKLPIIKKPSGLIPEARNAPVPHEHEIPEPPRLVEEIKAMPAPPPPPPSGPAVPSSGFVGEFARLKTVEKSPKERTPPSPAAMEDTAPPTMLHEETPIKSAPQTSSFKIEAPTPKLSDIRAKESEIPRPAIIDFGGSTSFGPAQDKPLTAGGSTSSPQEKPPVPPPLPKTKAPESKPSDATPGKPFDSAQGKPFDGAQGKPPRIVHYTEFRTPLDNARDKPLDNARDKPLDNARGKPLEKPPEKPSEISGAQAPSNVPLAENPLSKISGENPERKELVPEPKAPPTPPAIEQP